MPSVAVLSTGKNFATSSVVCVNWKFEPSAGAEIVSESKRVRRRCAG